MRRDALGPVTRIGAVDRVDVEVARDEAGVSDHCGICAATLVSHRR
jgi:hypothetical protein